MSLTYVFSFGFFIACTIYIFLGMYTLFLNTKSILNRVFFVCCLALCIWGLCFSFANSAKDYNEAVFWYRFSSIGWGTFYSCILHFFFILTERNEILKKKWFYLLIYLPATVNILVFGISDIAEYNLVKTKSGWINSIMNTWGQLFFNIHFISFSFVGLLLLIIWCKRTNDLSKKRQANILIFAFVIAFVAGTMTDIIINKFLPFSIPQIGPMIALIPIFAIFYAIKRFGLMGPSIKNHIAEPGNILSEFNLAQIYHIMSMVFIFGGLLSFVARYFFLQVQVDSLMLFSLVFFLYGIIFQVIQRINIRNSIRDIIFIILTATSVPIITFRVIEYASISVWAMPFIFIILFVVFNKRRMIVWLSISILFTQICVWIKAPFEIVQVDGSDHVIRIGIFSIAIWIAFYVNRVYIHRLEENESQISFQKLVSLISADFVNITESNLNEKIDGMLQQIGEYFQVDRAYLFVLSKDLKIGTCTHEWCNEGIESAMDSSKDLHVDSFLWWMDQLLYSGMVHVPNVENLPIEAKEIKELLKNQKVQSLLSVSVTSKGKILGFLGFDSVKGKRAWRQDHQELLKILTNLLADALVKVEAEKKINHMAYYDALTGLPNRAMLKDRLEQAIYLANRTEKLIVLIFIDLDSFKAVNDTMGHDGGDELIKLVAERLASSVRKQDTVARSGGDEFFIMLTQIADTEDIYKIAEGVMSIFDQPLEVNNQEFFFTASAGIAVYPVDGEDSETLIKNADLAMYSAKDKGKNQYTLCSAVMKEDVLKKMQLTNSLYRALERNELMLYYQPQVDVLTKEIVGLEALIRWNHPELGMVSPGVFIPLAEQTGLINPIGKWVLKTACIQNKKWQDMGLAPLRMAVNLSVEQFKNPNLVSIVESTLIETGLEPKYLELEVTESTAVLEASYIADMLYKLKELGVSIAIDDFGTEYSSLNRLKTLPVDRIKIDIQFVRGISEGNKDEAIAKIIIQLAKNLQLSVIAEGVETDKQFEFFREHICDEIQGYYFYRPMPSAELETLLINQSKKN